MKHKRAYLYRCYPTREQVQHLARTFGCARFVYNWALRLRTDAYKQRGEHVFYSDTSAALTTLKQQEATSWLNEVSCVPPQQSLRHLDKAFKNFFEGRAKYPTFKKKPGRQSAEYTTSAFTWDGKDLRQASMREPLPIRWSRPLPTAAKPTTITVTKDAAGRYFVSFLVEEDISPLPASPKTVGIDLGLHDVVTLSTGEKTDNEHSFARDEKRLAMRQRRHAKKQKKSKNREKARRKVARIHAREAFRRRDFAHQLTTRIIRENQVVCVESLAVKNLLQNHCLAKSIADVGWGELIRQLQYKATWNGRSVVAIDRFYPSSKQCHACGHVLDSLDLDERSWTCPNCGMVHDRDINAALTIKAAGLAVFACGEQVETKPAWNQGRRDSAKQETHPARGGISSPLGDCEDVNLLHTMPNTPFTYLVVIRWSARERAFIAKAPGLSGCIGSGDTYQAALNFCLEAMQWRAEHAEQREQPLPPAELSWSNHTVVEITRHSSVL